MTPRKPGDYPVGYGKPPEASRFRKGRSGNPTGRPKGRATLATVLQRALAARVTVTEHGRRTRKSKLEIALTQLVNKAAGGDLGATRLLVDLFPLLDPAAASAIGLPDLAADRELAERYIARMAAAVLSTTPPTRSEA
jgi:Family of unknown function (DUF5681)